MLDDITRNSLIGVASLLSGAQDPWWIIGSASVALKGYSAGQIADIDVLVSPADADRLMARHGLDNLQDGGTARYRSSHFLRPIVGEVPVEIMAGYEIFRDHEWRPVWPPSRERIRVGRVDIFAPSDADLIDILKRLERAKDLARIQAMTQPK